MFTKYTGSLVLALSIFFGGISSVMAHKPQDNLSTDLPGCWKDNDTYACIRPVDDSVKQSYSRLYKDDHWGAYVTFGRTDGTEAILMLEPNKISIANSRSYCYIQCDAVVGGGSAPNREKVGLTKIWGYYDDSRTCQPMMWPAAGPIENEIINQECARNFKDMVPDAQKWVGSGNTFYWMLHTEKLIHLQ